MILYSGTTENLRKEVSTVEGMTLEKLQVIIEAQTKAYYQELQKVQNQTRAATNAVSKQTDRIKQAFSKIGVAVAAALSIRAIVNFGKACIELGSDLAEVQNVVDVTFGDMSSTIDEFAKNAIEQFGLSETSAKQYASTMGAMLKSMGFTQSAAADMSMELTGLAGDLASFYNLDGDEAFAKIRSGISGETEPLKQLGINLSVANLQQYALTQGITKSYSAMNQQEQALLRYNYLLSVTSDAQGDFSRTSDGWANQVRILTERFNSFKATIGQGLINVFTPVLKVINQVIAKLQVAADAFLKFTNLISGKKASTSSVGSVASDAATATTAMDDLGTATTAAGTSAKKTEEAYHGLGSFDEINSLTKASDDSSGSGSGSGADVGTDIADAAITAADETDQTLNPVLDKLIEKLKELKDLFTEGFKNGLGDATLEPLQKAIEGIKASLKDIFTDPEVVKAADNYLNTLAYSLGQQIGAITSIGISIATNLLGGINKYLDQNKQRIKDFLVDMFDIGAEVATIQGNFAAAVANIFSAVGGENGQQLTANLIGIFADSWMATQELSAKAGRDILDVFTRPFIDNQEGLKTALDGILGVFVEATGSIKDVVDQTADKANEVYDGSVKPLMEALAAGLSDTVGKFVDFWNTDVQPVLEQMASKFGTLMSEHIQPLLDQVLSFIGSVAEAITAFWNGVLKPLIDWIIAYILPVLLPILQTIWDTVVNVIGNIADVLSGIISVIQGIIDFVVGVFTGDWDKAWNGIKEIVSGIMEAISGVIGAVLNIIGGVVKVALNTISGVFSVIFNGIKSLIQTIFSTISNIIKTAITAIKTNISSVLNSISTIWSTLWNGMKTTVISIFNGIWSAIKGVINSILGGIESMCNGVINGVNAVVKALNNLSFDIPDWVPEFGGKTFGFSIPTLSTVSLPRLAKGGIIDEATPLIAGEAGQEAIVPLENNTGWIDKIAARIGEILSVNVQGVLEDLDGGYQTIQTIVQLDSKTLVEQTDKYRKRKGYQLKPT